MAQSEAEVRKLAADALLAAWRELKRLSQKDRNVLSDEDARMAFQAGIVYNRVNKFSLEKIADFLQKVDYRMRLSKADPKTIELVQAALGAVAVLVLYGKAAKPASSVSLA